MGKGDKRTRRGKLFAGSHGKTRSRTTNKAALTAKLNKKKNKR
jgi:ribosomal small subunit protein bTHX